MKTLNKQTKEIQKENFLNYSLFSLFITFLFSIPDFLKFLIPIEKLQGIQNIIPLSQYSLGWMLPALVTFIVLNLFEKKQ